MHLYPIILSPLFIGYTVYQVLQIYAHGVIVSFGIRAVIHSFKKH